MTLCLWSAIALGLRTIVPWPNILRDSSAFLHSRQERQDLDGYGASIDDKALTFKRQLVSG